MSKCLECGPLFVTQFQQYTLEVADVVYPVHATNTRYNKNNKKVQTTYA